MILPQTAKAYNGICARCQREVVALEAAKLAAERIQQPRVLRVDEDLFDKYERNFMRELVQRLKRNLQDFGIPHDKLQDAVATVAFSIAATLDNCAEMMQPDGTPLIPVLTFENAEGAELIGRSSGTYMHEYISEVVDEVFSEID